MKLANHLTPLNLVEEKTRFFSDFSYNPQFVYDIEFEPEQLYQWGMPKAALAEFSLNVLKKHGFSEEVTPHEIPEEIVAERCQILFKTLAITEPVEVLFNPHKITRCSVSGLKMTFRSPVMYSSDAEFESTLNHEIQTHLLRNLNQKKQGWTLNDDTVLNVRRTEEGMAVLHGSLPHPDTFLRKAFMNYYAVQLAYTYSFADMFAHLQSWGLTPKAAWDQTMRSKRGLHDTSQLGGNTKDIIYLEGSLAMWKWISNPDHNPTDLYLGKIAIEEIAERKQMVTTTEVYLPLFLQDQNQYKEDVRRIGRANYFEQLDTL